MEKNTALQLCIDTTDPGNPVCNVRWNIRREAFSFLDGFEEYVICDGCCYPGPRSVLNTVAHLSDGIHKLDEAMLTALRRHYQDAPYLFTLQGEGPKKSEPSTPRQSADTQKSIRQSGHPTNVFRYFGFERFPSCCRTSGTQFGRQQYTVCSAQKDFHGRACAVIFFPYSHIRAENGKFSFFTIEARRFAEYRPEKAEFVPFTCYWPIYSKMSREQRAGIFTGATSFGREMH